MKGNNKLKYEFTAEEVNYLIAQLDRVQIVGYKAAQSLLHISNLLNNPIKEDLKGAKE